ncbi:medium-chain fatty acid-CoA ligase faa2 [Polyrhizophydium stewartii]|uniref:Long-chain-fatty-acid--CoA ligase n=1 Tax=Polyrhizophydium stewartii TaxID=2732419 RepID=A0ABR4MWP4_9FUNG
MVLPPIYRSALSPDKLIVGLPYARTVHEIFEHTVKSYPNSPAFGTRHASVDPATGAVVWGPFVFETYAQVAKKRDLFAYGLDHIYTKILGGSRLDKWSLALYAPNRAEWVIADFAGQALGLSVVALYDTLGPDTAEFILNHADVPVVVTTIDKIPLLLGLVDKTKLKAIIVLDTQPSMAVKGAAAAAFEVARAWAKEKGIAMFTFNEVLDLGEKNPGTFRPPSPDDVFCLCYTSGTTGNPKGAILVHSNMTSTIRANQTQYIFNNSDVHISYLPLAHIYERQVLMNVLSVGAAIGFYRGDVALLLDDIAALSPTIFPSVPRLLNRIYDRIMQQALNSGSAVKTALFRRALDTKIANMRANKVYTHAFWDALVFSKIKAVLGGRVRVMISGSAPINGDVIEFLRAAFGCQVVEGYGQTETTALISCAWANDTSKGNVGPVAGSMELKLVSVPSMNYHAKDLKGEIWVRGPGVFKGYHKDPEKTREALTEDGWLLTGDIASMDSKGRISIIDRKKNIFKLAQGEYVAPEKIENIYLKSSFVAQIFVHGDSLQSELVAIVVPDPEFSVKWAIGKGLLPQSTSLDVVTPAGVPAHPTIVKLCSIKAFRDAVQADLDAIGKEFKLRGFEFVKAIHLEPTLFSIESGLLTPTFKLKRHDASIKYRAQIDEMYKAREPFKPAAKL